MLVALQRWCEVHELVACPPQTFKRNK